MIKLENISKEYGGKNLFSNFSAEFEEHRVSCILGASGVGKTTLINFLAGLVTPDSGRINFSSDTPLRASYVFQEPRLLPWYNVHDNLDLILRNARPLSNGKKVNRQKLYTKEERAKLIKQQLRLVGLEDYEFSAISELSGGMIQRVALCRAFLYPADILLLDEPFKGQDTRLKEELYETFFRSYENDSMRRTVLFVTHDISEALRLSDAIYVLSGRPAGIAGKFERREFDEDTENKIKALI
ncbi:MAG: ATP-binding cassette domain-containing protein [Clostridiales bacterium]|jgi:NitT/TauT family transport system ATP-binding protein|nr:ATP-binding cassette domain-containing protein [Clostridiales bacterium]